MSYTHEDIQVNAYYRWEKAGRPEGRDFEFWLEAERHFQRQAVSREIMYQLTELLSRVAYEETVKEEDQRVFAELEKAAKPPTLVQRITGFFRRTKKV